MIVNGTEKVYIEIFNNLDVDIKNRDANAAFIAIFPRYLIEGLVILVLVIVGFNVLQLNFNLLSLIPLFGSVLYSFQRLLPLVQQIYATWANYRTKYPSICEVVEELENNQNKKELVYLKKEFTFNKDIVLKKYRFLI